MSARRATCSLAARRTIVLAVSTLVFLTPRLLPAAAGDLDCSFGTGGTIIHDLGSIESALDGQLQSDGKIVTFGSASGAIRLTRFLPSGELDTTFGSGGTVVHAIAGLGSGGSLAVDSQDRLLVGSGITVSAGASTDQEVFVARFTSDGALDPAFGGGDGWTSFDFTPETAEEGTEAAVAVVVDASDRPIVGGSSDANGPVFNPSDSNLAVARLDTSGVLDTSFDGDGISIASSAGAVDDILRGLVLDPLGRIVAVGANGPPAGRNTLLARWTITGGLDTTFDSDGMVIYDASETGAINLGFDVGIDSTGAILALSVTPTPALARFTETGALDTSFAGDGILQQSFLGGQDVTEKVRIQGDDKILVTGWPVVSGNFHFAAMRFTTAGVLDSTWSDDGVVTTEIGFNSRAHAAILRDDQRLLLLGGLTNGTDLVMVRYLNDGQPNGPPTTTEILASSPNPSLVGQEVTVTYSVTSTGGAPSGTVSISDVGFPNCTGTVEEGACSLTWGATPGERTITASFPGGDGFCASSDTETHTVLVPTSTSFTFFDPNASVVGEPVLVGVSVGTPGVGGVGPVTGSVTLDDGSGASCVGVLLGGSTSCQLTPTEAGTRTWTVTYSRDGFFASSASTASRSVMPASTATAVVADTPDPSILLQPFQVDVVVSANPPGSGTPTGTVSVDDGAGETCTADLVGGLGSCMLTPTVPGSRNLSVTYPGDGNYAASVITEPHTVTDGVAPRVLAIADATGSSIEACGTVRSTVTGLQVTFDEPVLGADQIGSYRVLAAGPDGDFSTASCGAALGDDLERPLVRVSSDLDPTTPTITLLLDGRLLTDLIRLIVCETIEDLGTLPLDGDGDG
ncbi:MAG: Ig-like domain repeat protein, partial [Acidobacteriota bacterium]